MEIDTYIHGVPILQYYYVQKVIIVTLSSF